VISNADRAALEARRDTLKKVLPSARELRDKATLGAQRSSLTASIDSMEAEVAQIDQALGR
jgi:hypothetical protein